MDGSNLGKKIYIYIYTFIIWELFTSSTCIDRRVIERRVRELFGHALFPFVLDDSFIRVWTVSRRRRGTSLAPLFKLKVKHRRGRITTLRYPVHPGERSWLVHQQRGKINLCPRARKNRPSISFRFEGRVTVDKRQTAGWTAKWLRK